MVNVEKRYNSNANRNVDYLEFSGDGILRQFQFINGSFDSSGTGFTYSANTWYHICGAWPSSGNSTLYVNGVAVDSTALSNSTPTGINTTRIGGFIDSNGATLNYFNGSIDDSRVYNRELSPTEIATLYQAGEVKFNTSPTNFLTNGLVGYWTMDGRTISGTSMTDQSGQGNTGTLVNTPTQVIGKIGQGLQFDGSSQYIDAGTPVMPTSAFTLSGWIYPTSYASVQGQIISKGYDGSNTQWELILLNSGKAQIDTYVTPTQKGVTSSATIPLNKWTYLTGSFDGTTWRIYINDSLDSFNVQSGPVATGAKLDIGAVDIIGTSGQYFPGKIDDVRIYNRALSLTEIRQLYNAGAVKLNVTRSSGNLSQGLVGYWTLDGKDTNWGTNTTSDVSGNGNTGTMVGLATTTSPIMGKIGQALNFSSTLGNVNVAANPTTAVDNVTFSAWIKVTNSSQANILLYNGNGSSNGYGFIIANGSCGPGNELSILLGGLFCDVLSSTYVPPLNQWILATGMRVSGTWKLYINGELQVTGAATTPNTPDTSAGNGFVFGYNDSLDDVRIYNRALSPTEVKQLYNIGR